MSRKGENIRKRKDGRWEARYIKSRNEDGSIRYGYLYAKTYREVREKKNKKISETPYEALFSKKTVELSSNATIEEITQSWKRKIRHTVKDSTYSNYETILTNQILPILGKYIFKNMNNKDIWRFLQQKMEQDLSNGTIHVILSVLKGILNHAESMGLYPAEGLKIPRIAAGGNEIKIMEPEDYRLLEKRLMERLDNFTFGILLCMHTGIRVGELSGLQWGDFNLCRKNIQIKRTVTRIKNLDQIPDPESQKIGKTILHIGPPKTTNSMREIPLPDLLVNLAQLLKKHEESFVLTGTNKCMEPRIIQRKYAALLKECEIQPIKIHSLRHQFSCRWVEQGFDTKSLSEILGHTSVRTTLDLYVHIREDTKRNYMNQLVAIHK